MSSFIIMLKNERNMMLTQRFQVMILIKMRISRHIQQIIKEEEDNDHREGKSEDDIQLYNRIERKKQYQCENASH